MATDAAAVPWPKAWRTESTGKLLGCCCLLVEQRRVRLTESAFSARDRAMYQRYRYLDMLVSNAGVLATYWRRHYAGEAI
jgi:hypothetical protein